ncbi:MAG: LpxL/LpxP family Kdo(2)-lipid IV(A) lauroyl/palmitoleoyl acyltransferase [Cellvibrionaceae bacterium]
MDTITKPTFHFSLLHPRYWSTWLLFAVWFLVAQLPFRAQKWIGKGLGQLMLLFASERRHVAEKNIQMCFPHLSQKEQRQLLIDNFYSTAFAFFETGIAWFWSKQRLKKLFHVEGLEQLQRYQNDNQGALMLILHFTTLEMWGVACNQLLDNIDMTYRPHRNPVYDLIQSWGRARHNPTSDVIAVGDVRSMVRSLKSGHFISYFPDQDHGSKHSVFVPLFGNPAATVTALARLIKMAKVPVVPLMCKRKSDGHGYDLKVLPAWKNYPSGDDERDAITLNEHVEQCILEQPDQYLWVHRRFKSRPEGEDPVYTPKKRRSRKRPK